MLVIGIVAKSSPLCFVAYSFHAYPICSLLIFSTIAFPSALMAFRKKISSSGVRCFINSLPNCCHSFGFFLLDLLL